MSRKRTNSEQIPGVENVQPTQTMFPASASGTPPSGPSPDTVGAMVAIHKERITPDDIDTALNQARWVNVNDMLLTPEGTRLLARVLLETYAALQCSEEQVHRQEDEIRRLKDQLYRAGSDQTEGAHHAS